MMQMKWKWSMLAACLALALSACGGGGSTDTLAPDQQRGFSIVSDNTDGTGTASFRLEMQQANGIMDVSILADNAIDLTGMFLHVSYDPLEYRPAGTVFEGPFDDGGSVVSISVDRDPGVLHLGAVQTDNAATFSGSDTVATLRFENRAFAAGRVASTPPALGNAATGIDYNNLTGQLSWYYANPGDTNQDGLVNLADLVPIARDYQAQGPFVISSRQSVADANGDGEVNLSDVSVLGANWNTDTFGGYNVLTSAEESSGGQLVGNVPFASAIGNPSGERLRFTYVVPAGQRDSFAWVQPVDGVGSAGLAGDAAFANVTISGPTASFMDLPGSGSGSSDDPFVVESGESLSYVVYDPQDGDITEDAGLSVWLEPAIAGTVSSGLLDISESYSGNFVMRGSYQDQSMVLLASGKAASEAGPGQGDGAFFFIDGCLDLRLDHPELEGNGSIWHPYKVSTAGETLDFSVWHCELGEVTDSEHLSWGWQPEGAGEFNWDLKKYTFFQQFTGLWVIEVQWEAEGHVSSDHLYFLVDPHGGGNEAGLELKVGEGIEGGMGLPDNPYIICNTTHEIGLKAWHSELGDITTNEHLIWHLKPETAGVIHPEWHQMNISEGFLGTFDIEIVWETAGQRLSDRKYFKVQECEGGEVFEIKVFEGISGGEGTQQNPYKVCINEVWEFGIKAWHHEFGDVTAHEGTTWNWYPESAGQMHPEWRQFNMAEGFTGFFSIRAVHHREDGTWEDTKFFTALECENPEQWVEIKVLDGFVDGNGSAEHPYIICNDTHEFGVKGWHSVLGDITQNEHTTWIVDSPAAGVMHPEWHQFNVSQGFLGNFVIKLIFEAEGHVLDDIKHFKVIECEQEAFLTLETDLEAEGGDGSQELPFKFCRGSVGEIFFDVIHSELGVITYDPHLSWSTEPAAAGEFRPDFSDFVVNPEYLGVFTVTCHYTTDTQSLSKTLWFKQIECEFPDELVLVVTNPPEHGDGSEGNPYIYPQNPIEIGLKFLHPELGDITDNENVVWDWNPENAGEFRPQYNDFRVANEFTGFFWISAGWPTEGGIQTRYVHIIIGNNN